MTQLEDARNRLDEALADLSKAQGLDAREKMAEAAGERALAQDNASVRLRAAQA